MKYLVLISFLIPVFISCRHEVKEIKEDNLVYTKAFTYLDKGLPDSAFFYFNSAKDLFLRQKDSLGAGKCLLNMGMISTDKGDYFGAQEISLTAHSYFNAKKEDQYGFIRSNYNNLGLATHYLKEYKSAIKFFDAALGYSKNTVDTIVLLNNKARSLQVLKEYPIALKLYLQVLRRANNNRKEFARVLTNITYTKWLMDSAYNVVPNYLKALQIRIQEKDVWGQNSSYSHLADYYAKMKPDSALFYAHKMYNVAKTLNSAYDKMEALQQLIKLSPVNASKNYFDTYQKLNDSVQNSRQNAKNQFALVRYETEKHKTDFLNAQAENLRKQHNIIIQNFLLVILALILISAYFWYRKQRKLLQREKELEVKSTELKYVKKIHDRVANRVYHVMSEVENSNQFDKDVLLDKLELLYNISRDISYEDEDGIGGNNYSEQLSEMLQSYSSESTEILIVGNDDELWNTVSATVKSELFYMLQELMTNMKKHSKATTVVLRFQCKENNVSVLYSDNGVGMKSPIKNNGLTNTENRIKSILGTITFDNKPEEGLAIQLSIPLS